jgi:hypothetical protein
MSEYKTTVLHATQLKSILNQLRGVKATTPVAADDPDLAKVKTNYAAQAEYLINKFKLENQTVIFYSDKSFKTELNRVAPDAVPKALNAAGYTEFVPKVITNTKIDATPPPPPPTSSDSGAIPSALVEKALAPPPPVPEPEEEEEPAPKVVGLWASSDIVIDIKEDIFERDKEWKNGKEIFKPATPDDALKYKYRFSKGNPVVSIKYPKQYVNILLKPDNLIGLIWEYDTYSTETGKKIPTGRSIRAFPQYSKEYYREVREKYRKDLLSHIKVPSVELEEQVIEFYKRQAENWMSERGDEAKPLFDSKKMEEEHWKYLQEESDKWLKHLNERIVLTHKGHIFMKDNYAFVARRKDLGKAPEPQPLSDKEKFEKALKEYIRSDEYKEIKKKFKDGTLVINEQVVSDDTGWHLFVDYRPANNDNKIYTFAANGYDSEKEERPLAAGSSFYPRDIMYLTNPIYVSKPPYGDVGDFVDGTRNHRDWRFKGWELDSVIDIDNEEINTGSWYYRYRK